MEFSIFSHSLAEASSWMIVNLVLVASIAIFCFIVALLSYQPTSRVLYRHRMISEKVYASCQNGACVTSELANGSDASPGDAFQRLYGSSGETSRDGSEAEPDRLQHSPKSLKRAHECGQWGSQRPSDLFLKIYHDALCCLDRDPKIGLVSPSLMGACGIVPLTVIGPLPDICRHMSNCIVRAEKEIILVTSYWASSDNAKFLTNAMKELSRRAGLKGEKVQIKMMYDRAGVKQFLNPRQSVNEKEAASPKVQLPLPGGIPNVNLQVLNYHCPVVGTLHSKFMIVDRKFALLESNNIQDNDNLEMMVRFEGPIVDSFYDMALITWNNALNPPLPLINTPARDIAPPSYSLESPVGCSKDSVWSSQGDIGDDIREQKPNDLAIPEHTADDPHYDADINGELTRITSSLTPHPGESRRECVTHHLNIVPRPDISGDAPEWDEEDDMTPYILLPPHEPFPMAMVNRAPWGALNHSSVHTPQNAAFFAAFENAEHSVFIQTPNLNAEPLLEPLLNAVRRGIIVTCYLCLGYNDAGQLLPFQNGINEMISNRLYNSLSSDNEKSRLRIYNYVAKDQTKPLHNSSKKRSCHIKLMIIDEKVAIQGSGNLDTQTFFHSQETNVLLDSPLVCKSWLEALRRNQNTATYGAVSKVDGCWHDPDTGELAPGSIGTDPGSFSWLKGFVGAVKRARGIGGF